MRFLTVILAVLAAPVSAQDFDRPIPQPQSATAEFWYALAFVAFIAALVAVQRLVARR